MKKLNTFSKLMPVMALAASLSACTFQQEDFFDETAALRIEHTNQDIKDKLVAGSTNGNCWLIQYFVAGTDDMDFEGFNLFARFEETGKVTLSGNHRYIRNGKANQYTEYTSIYEMLKEEGSVLSFSTWNDLLTVFVDPVSPTAAPGTLQGDGEGMNGDDRLVMISYSDDQMLFRGERHSAKVYFTRISMSPEEYLAKTQEMRDHIATQTVNEYRLTDGVHTCYLSGLDHGYFNVVDRLDDPLQSTTHSCVFTPNGFLVQNGFELVGAEKGETWIHEMTVNDSFTQLVSGPVTMTPLWIRGVRRKVSTANATVITAEGGSESFVNMYNTLADAIKGAFSAQTFTGITFGKSSEAGSNSRNGIVFNVTASKNKYLTGFTATVTIDTENNTATITADANDYSTNFSNYSKKGLGDYFTNIVNAMVGTYNLEPNDSFCPTVVKWTKTSDPSFYFQTKF